MAIQSGSKLCFSPMDDDVKLWANDKSFDVDKRLTLIDRVESLIKLFIIIKDFFHEAIIMNFVL